MGYYLTITSRNDIKTNQIKKGYDMKLLEVLQRTGEFRIKYYAKKYGKEIIRNGTWGEKSRVWEDKKGNRIFTYYDLDQKEYRSAVEPTWWFNISFAPSKEELH
jgi:hypothetical protein